MKVLYSKKQKTLALTEYVDYSGTMGRQKIISLNKDDFKWQVFRGFGKGGQKRNKTSNAVRCIHEASGAVGEAEDGRSQDLNRKMAFKRMADSPEFKTWLKLQHDIYLGKVKLETHEGGEWREEPFDFTEKGAK